MYVILGRKYNIRHIVVSSESILAWNYQFTTTWNTLINILIIGLESNCLENNKTKVEITRVFEIVLQCSVFLKHISNWFRVQSLTQHMSWNNTSFQNVNNWFRVRQHLITEKKLKYYEFLKLLFSVLCSWTNYCLQFKFYQKNKIRVSI